MGRTVMTATRGELRMEVAPDLVADLSERSRGETLVSVVCLVCILYIFENIKTLNGTVD